MQTYWLVGVQRKKRPAPKNWVTLFTLPFGKLLDSRNMMAMVETSCAVRVCLW